MTSLAPQIPTAAPIDPTALDAYEVDPRRIIVVVAPHPDDEVIGFGGALYDHVRRGGHAVVVAVTDGGAYDPQATPADRWALAGTRREEQHAALAHLGMPTESVIRLGVADGEVADHERAVRDEISGVVELLDSFGPPPLLVTPYRADSHPDHEATTRAVFSAAGSTGCVVIEVPIWSWFHRSEVALPTGDLRVVRTSSAAQAAKRAALSCHASQIDPLAGGRPPILSSAFLAAFDRGGEVVIV